MLAIEEPLPKEEKSELKADNIPIKNVNIRPIPHKTTAKMLPRYKEKFGRTYDLSLHPQYPTNIPPKNTENTTVNRIYVNKSINPLAMNEDHTIDPTNRKIPKIINENIIIEMFVFSDNLSKNPSDSFISIFRVLFRKS